MRRPQRELRHLGLATVVAALLAFASPSTAVAQGITGPTGLVPGGDPPDVMLLHSGDVIGYLEPCG